MTSVPTIGQSNDLLSGNRAEVEALLLQMQGSADALFNELKVKSHEERQRIVRSLAAEKEIICAVYPVAGGFGYQVIKGVIDADAFTSGRAQSIPCASADQIGDLLKVLTTAL